MSVNKSTTIQKNWQQKQFTDCIDLDSLKKLSGLKKSAYQPSGKTPIFDQAKDYVSGYTDDDSVVNENFPVILFGDHTRVVKYIDRPYVVGADGTKVFKTAKDVYPKFLYYYLSNTDIPNTGYNRHFKWLKALNILLPPLPEQQKIAKILGAVDEEIEKVSEEIEKSEELKRGLMQKFFEESKEVKFKKLKEVTSNIEYGYTTSAKQKDTGLKFLRITDITNGYLDWSGVPFCDMNDKNKKFLLEDGDIVFARTGATTGWSYYIENPPEAVFASYLIRVQTSKEFNAKYLYYFFQSSNYWKQISAGMSGSAQGGFNATKLGNLSLPVPKMAQQNTIAEILSDIDKKIEITKKLKHNLIKLKKGLMQDLLSGKIPV